MGKMNIDLLKGIEEQENAIDTEKQAGSTGKSKKEQDIETFLELLKQGKSRKEAYEIVGHDKSWASRLISELREKAPDRLKGTSEEIKEKVPAEQIEKVIAIQDTPQPPQEPQIATEPPHPIKSTPEEESRVYVANTKPQKQSFSFRAEQSKIENWKLYAETVGTGDMGTLWTAAIDEYIANHKLTADQQIIYDLKKQALEKQKELSANKK